MSNLDILEIRYFWTFFWTFFLDIKGPKRWAERRREGWEEGRGRWGSGGDRLGAGQVVVGGAKTAECCPGRGLRHKTGGVHWL